MVQRLWCFAFALLGACGTAKDSGPTPVSCMKRGEFGTITSVRSIPHRFHPPGDSAGDIHVTMRTYVNFRMSNGASRVCESSEGATVLGYGDKISATEMVLTNLGVSQSEPTIE
jgi:hypothetical protein